MVKMIATTRFVYGTRRLKADDPFDARTKTDARALVAYGQAAYATKVAEPIDGTKLAKPTVKKAAKKESGARKAKAAK